ncbi:hypothetical protein HY357_02645 [Candidatus Roizmanbacteria bacterium]|nr:hypothetical protein [Candidatus Roizmanbacteria bacterium]
MRIYQLFFEIFSRTHSKDSFLLILDDILTPVEKIMLAKRIGMIYLLIKKVDNSIIAETLKVSTSTVSIYSVQFYKRNSKVVEIIKNMLIKEKLLGFLDDVFADLFIQPGIKIGHHDLKWQHKLIQEKRKVFGV